MPVIKENGKDVFYERKARTSTGTTIVLEDTARTGAEFQSQDGCRFVAACREHGTVAGLPGAKWGEAYKESTDPRKWCQQCAEMPEKEKTEPTTEASVGKAPADQTQEDRLANLEAARKAQAAARQARAEAELVAAREELVGLPAREDEANAKYEEAFAAANRARGTREEVQRAWNAADQAMDVVLALGARRRYLEELVAESGQPV